MAEIIQRVRPDVLLINEFDFDARGTALRLFQDNYLSVPHNGAAADRLPLRLTAPSNTGIPSGLRPEQQRRFTPVARLRRRRVRLRLLPRPVRHGRLLEVPDRRRRHPDVPALPVEGHAGRPAARRPGDPGRRRLVLPRRARRASGCRRRATGTCRSRSAARPCTSWSATRPRRSSTAPEDRNGTRNFDEIRLWADYVTARRTAGYIYDDAGRSRRPAAGRDVRDRRRPELRPARRRQHPGLRSSSCSTTRGSTRRPRPTARAASRRPRCRAAPTSTHRVGPAYDTADFCGHVQRRATCAPTTCCRPRPCGSGTRRLLAGRGPTRCSG